MKRLILLLPLFLTACGLQNVSDYGAPGADSTVPTKSTGDTLSAAEVNDIVTAVNSKEDGLGNPAGNDYFLKSQTDGTRSWSLIDSADVSVTPSGNISSDNLGDALNELDAEKVASSTLQTAISNNSDVVANTAKVSFDSTSSTRLADTSGTNTGDQSLSDVITLFDSGSCSGYLKSDGTCDSPTGTDTIGWAYTPLSSAPGTPVAGKVYWADNDTWDPLTYAGTDDYAVMYDGSGYVGIIDINGNLLIESLSEAIAIADGDGTGSLLWAFAFSAQRTITIPGDADATLTTEVASGTSALGTSAISDGACATVVTTTATGTATTDVVSWGFNGDPTSITGYNPSGDLLYIVAYPTANNVNFKVCNKSGSSITPGAITLNWRVDR